MEQLKVYIDEKGEKAAQWLANQGVYELVVTDYIRGLAPGLYQLSGPGDAAMPQLETLVGLYEAQTRIMSASGQMRRLTSYRSLLGIGEAAVPALIKALPNSRSPVALMLLLGDLTGQDPVPADAQGDTAQKINAWLTWAQARSSQ